MTTLHRIALLGFSAFERNTLGSYFRLASTREPRYEQVQILHEADFVVADADHAPSVQLVQAVERMPETVFVGARPPDGAIAWMARPIDPMRVLRELDVMAARRVAAPARVDASPDAGGRRRTVIQPVRPQRPQAPAALLEPDDSLDLTLPDLPDLPVPQPATQVAQVAPAATSGLAAPTVPSAPALQPAPALPASVLPPASAVPPASSVAPASALPSVPAAPAASAPAAAARPVAARPEVPRVAAEVSPQTPAQARPEAVAASGRAVPAPPARAAASMPAAAAQPATARPAGPQRAPGAPLPSTALLVDDSDVALRFLQKKLAPFGLVTDCVSHSAEAIERLARRRYDFVFLDMELGERSPLDGLGLCQHIKREPAAANVVMVTAHHTELDRVRGALAGCDGFLGKPLDEEELALYLARFGVKPAANAGCVPS